MPALHVACASLPSTSRFTIHKRARMVTDQALLIESSASAVISCAVRFVVNRTCHARNAHPCITRPLLQMCVAHRFGTTRATVVADTGSSFLSSFLLSLSPCTALTSQLGLKTRCLKQYTTRKAGTTRSESGVRVVCFIDCTAFVLHPNATHLEDGATRMTTTSFDVRHDMRCGRLF